jgi:hypothetical protein
VATAAPVAIEEATAKTDTKVTAQAAPVMSTESSGAPETSKLDDPEVMNNLA